MGYWRPSIPNQQSGLQGMSDLHNFMKQPLRPSRDRALRPSAGQSRVPNTKGGLPIGGGFGGLLKEAAKDLAEELAEPLTEGAADPEGWVAGDHRVGWTKILECADQVGVCLGGPAGFTPANSAFGTCVGCGTYSSGTIWASLDNSVNANPTKTFQVQWRRKTITTGRHWKQWEKVGDGSLARRVVAAAALAGMNAPAGVPDPIPGHNPGPGGMSSPSPSSSPAPTPANSPAWVPKKYVPGYADPVPEIVLRPNQDWAPLPKRDDPPNGTHYKLPDLSKKIEMPAWLYAIVSGYHNATEVNDFFESLADAIPGGACSKMPGFQRALCVLENFEDIDWDKAIENLILNQIEDKVIGTVMGQLGKTGGGYGDPNITRSTSYIRNLMGNI